MGPGHGLLWIFLRCLWSVFLQLRLSVAHPVFPVLLSCSSLICSGANREEMEGCGLKFYRWNKHKFIPIFMAQRLFFFCGRKVIDRILSLSYLFFKQLHPALSTWRDWNVKKIKFVAEMLNYKLTRIKYVKNKVGRTKIKFSMLLNN
jgi:hypothetical protein